ncbi:MAG: YfhO family protein, partial [Cytophagales bacterium]
ICFQMLNTIKPHFFSIALIVFIVIGFYSPIFLKSKTLRQSDIEQGIGINQESKKYNEETGDIALWFGNVFSGMPSFILGYPFSDDIKSKITSLMMLKLKDPAGIHFLMMLSLYVFGFVLTRNSFLAIFISIAFTFSTFNILSLEAGHNAKIRAIALLPFILTGIILLNQKKWLLGLALTAFGAALHVNCAHYQISYYFFLALGLGSFIWLIFEFLNKNMSHGIKVMGLSVFAIILGLGSNFGKLWSSMDYQKQSIRGKFELTPKEEDNRAKTEGLDKDYAFSWSQGISESLTFLIPGAFGGSSSEEVSKNSAIGKVLRSQNIPLQPMPLYFGEQPFTGGPIYAGAVVCFFFVLSFFVLKKNELIIIASTFAVFMMIAWGKNFEALNYFLFDNFPYFNKFRAVSMALFVPLFVMSATSILTIFRISEMENKEILLKPIIYSAGGIGVLCLFLALFPGIMVVEGINDTQLPEWIKDPLEKDRMSLVSSDAVRTLFLVALAASALFVHTKGLINKNVFFSIIAVLALFDLWSVNTRYLTKDDYVAQKKNEQLIQPSLANTMILNDKEPGYRVFNIQNPFNDGRTSFFHRSVGGYHPAKMRRYQDLIENHLSENNRNVIRMLNVKYIIKGNGERDVIPMPDRCGAAWFVDSLIKVKSPDEESETLKNFEPSSMAIVDVTKFPACEKITPQRDSNDKINLIYYSPNKLIYESENGANRLAVFSEIYYSPGWSVTVNGEKKEHFRVNYVLRAMELPAGKNKIEFKFMPETYTMGKTVTNIFNIIVLGLFMFAVGFSAYKAVKKD